MLRLLAGQQLKTFGCSKELLLKARTFYWGRLMERQRSRLQLLLIEKVQRWGEGTTMKLFWRERKSGQSLILCSDDETEVEVGMVRRTPRGFDALAKTNTYDPGRAKRGFASMEEAKAFVESFHPWDLFGGDWDMAVDPEVRRRLADTSSPTPDEVSQPVSEKPSRGKQAWQFWKKG
jgi:hypothetical protein